MPKTSKELLEELNRKKAVNDLIDWDTRPIDTNLYRDEEEVVLEQQPKQVTFQLQQEYVQNAEPDFDFGDTVVERENEATGMDYQADVEAAFYTEDNEEF